MVYDFLKKEIVEVYPTRHYNYLANRFTEISDEERLKIGERARKRILKEHTYRHRAETIISSVKGTGPGILKEHTYGQSDETIIEITGVLN